MRSRRSSNVCRREIAEIVGSQRRQQAHPDIGRRRAVRDATAVVLLIVVGGQPGVGRGDEGLEIAPRLARGVAKTHALGGGERSHSRASRHAEAVRDDRRAQPEHQERRRHAKRVPVREQRTRWQARRRSRGWRSSRRKSDRRRHGLPGPHSWRRRSPPFPIREGAAWSRSGEPASRVMACKASNA